MFETSKALWLEVLDSIDQTANLAGVLWMASNSIAIDEERQRIRSLASLLEERLRDTANRLRELTRLE